MDNNHIAMILFSIAIIGIIVLGFMLLISELVHIKARSGYPWAYTKKWPCFFTFGLTMLSAVIMAIFTLNGNLLMASIWVLPPALYILTAKRRMQEDLRLDDEMKRELHDLQKTKRL